MEKWKLAGKSMPRDGAIEEEPVGGRERTKATQHDATPAMCERLFMLLNRTLEATLRMYAGQSSSLCKLNILPCHTALLQPSLGCPSKDFGSPKQMLLHRHATVATEQMRNKSCTTFFNSCFLEHDQAEVALESELAAKSKELDHLRKKLGKQAFSLVSQKRMLALALGIVNDLSRLPTCYEVAWPTH
eukprot:1338375-Amphidinium_carterae.2